MLDSLRSLTDYTDHEADAKLAACHLERKCLPSVDVLSMQRIAAKFDDTPIEGGSYVVNAANRRGY